MFNQKQLSYTILDKGKCKLSRKTLEIKKSKRILLLRGSDTRP